MFNKQLRFSTFLTIFTLIFTTSLLAQENKEYEESFSFSQNGSVSIETYKGSISIETWDKDEFYFRAVVEPDRDGWSSTDPEEQLERCEVRWSNSKDYISLESDYEQDTWGNSGTMALVHYEIKMPATARLRIDDYKSKTDITNLKSDLDLETYKGVVNIVGYAGELNLETYKGDVEVDFTEFNDNCLFDTYKGDILLTLPSSSEFDFDFDLGRKGDFESEFEMIMKSYRSDEGARGKVNGGGPEISFSTYKGEIELRKKG